MAGRRPSNVRVHRIGSGGVGMEWDGEKVLSQIAAVNQEAMERVAARARQYWERDEWTPDRHPYMTGDEDSIKANGYMDVEENSSGTVSLYVGSTSDHTLPEEFGTSRQPAHMPIRNTVDHVAYTISDELRAAARRAGL